MSLKEERAAARKAAEEALRNTELPQELQALKDHFGDWLEVKVGDNAGPYLSREVSNYGYPPFLTLADELRELEEDRLTEIKQLFENISVTCGLFDKKMYLNFFIKGQEPAEKKGKKSGPPRGREQGATR
jgi:hypothetical protein